MKFVQNYIFSTYEGGPISEIGKEHISKLTLLRVKKTVNSWKTEIENNTSIKLVFKLH